MLFRSYFCGKAGSEEEKSTIYSTNLIGCALASVFALSVGWLLSGPAGTRILGVPDSAGIFTLGVLGLALSFPSESFLGRLRVENRAVTFITLQLIRLVLQVGLNVYLLVGLHLGFRSLLWSNILCNLAFSLFGAFATFRGSGVRFSPPLFVAMLRFAVPVVAVGLSLFVFHVADRFFLKRFASLEEIGLYALGYKLGMLITYAAMPFTQYWSAQSYEVLKGERGPEIFSRVFTYYLTIILVASVATLAFAEPALHVLTTPGFYSAIVFVPWVVLAYLLRLVAEYIRQILYISQRPGLDVVVNVSSAVFCLIAYSVLIPAHRAMGAAWATVSTAAVMLILSAWYGRRVFPVRFEIRPVAILIAGAAVVLALQRLLPASSLVPQLLSGAAACLVYLVVVVWFGAIGRDDRGRIQAAVRARLAAAF